MAIKQTCLWSPKAIEITMRRQLSTHRVVYCQNICANLRAIFDLTVPSTLTATEHSCLQHQNCGTKKSLVPNPSKPSIPASRLTYMYRPFIDELIRPLLGTTLYLKELIDIMIFWNLKKAEIQWEWILNKHDAQIPYNAFSNMFTEVYNRCFSYENSQNTNSMHAWRNTGHEPEHSIPHYQAYQNNLYVLLKAAEHCHCQDLLTQYKSNTKNMLAGHWNENE